MKSYMEISFLDFQLLEQHGQRKWLLDVRHYILQKRNWKNKTLFGHFDKKQKCSAFTFVRY